jgi:hypothetical protein
MRPANATVLAPTPHPSSMPALLDRMLHFDAHSDRKKSLSDPPKDAQVPAPPSPAPRYTSSRKTLAVTPRRQQAIQLLLAGKSDSAVARELGISRMTLIKELTAPEPQDGRPPVPQTANRQPPTTPDQRDKWPLT